MKKLLSQKAKDGLLSFTALRFYRNAQDFFNFFAPINLNVPIFCKYWGAVYCIIDEEVNDGKVSHLHSNTNQMIVELLCQKANTAAI